MFIRIYVEPIVAHIFDKVIHVTSTCYLSETIPNGTDDMILKLKNNWSPCRGSIILFELGETRLVYHHLALPTLFAY